MWNENDRKVFSKSYVLTCKMFDKEITYEMASFVIRNIEDLDFNKALSALDSFSRDPKSKFWPKIADIRNIINPVLDHRMVAVDLARKIDKAISYHGYNWEGGYWHSTGNYWENDKGEKFRSFKEAVISELGAVGWHAICSRGGWVNVRDSANTMDEGTFIAQMRDQIQSSITLAERGVDVSNIEMPKICESNVENKGNSLSIASSVIEDLAIKDLSKI
jgi:hypothetical protein